MASRTHVPKSAIANSEAKVVEGVAPQEVELEKTLVDVAIEPLSAMVEEESAELDLSDVLGSNGTPSADEEEFFRSLKVELDTETIAKQERDLYLPKGLYYFKESPDIKGRFLGNDRKANDKSTYGRSMWDISGIVVHTETKRERRYQFSLSPDKRVMTEGTQRGELDSFSQNYSKATTYFRKVNARTNRDNEELYNFLKKGDYTFYVSQSQSGNFFGRFQDKKK